jgi:hypothetical protein
MEVRFISTANVLTFCIGVVLGGLLTRLVTARHESQSPQEVRVVVRHNTPPQSVGCLQAKMKIAEEEVKLKEIDLSSKKSREKMVLDQCRHGGIVTNAIQEVTNCRRVAEIELEIAKIKVKHIEAELQSAMRVPYLHED